MTIGRVALMLDWSSDELAPRCDKVRAVRPGYRAEVEVGNSAYFRDGDLIAFPRTGERAFVTDISGPTLTLCSRHVSFVDRRWIRTDERWNGDEWVPVDIYEPLAIPHWYVRNLEARPGDEALIVGSTMPAS